MANQRETNLFQEDNEKIITIAEKIIQKHSALGANSPISPAVIADLNSRIAGAKAKQEEAMKYKTLMEAALRERDHYLGGKDKSVAYTLTAVLNILRSDGAAASDWGF